jgi:lipopolysaccharide biosynthesis glycosyltransferase
VTSPTPTQGCAIVCAVSADYGFALGNLIAGFRRHNPQFAGAFVVFHDGLTAGQQAQLRSLWPRIEFRDFGLEVLEARFQGTVELADVLAKYSPMIFAKFEMPDLLAQYAACLWLDVDVLVQGDLAEIWGFEGLAWRSLPQGAFARRAGVMDAFADLRGDGTLPLLNGGVVGMGQALRGVLASDDLYAMAAQVLAKAGAHSVDELALYFTAASRGLPFQPLDMRFNHPVVAPGGRDAVVLHAIGPDKFWNAAPLDLAFPEWAANAAVWAAAGGAGYDGPLRLADVQAATPDAALKAARNRAYWQQVYTDLRPSLPAALQVDLQSDRKDLRFSYLGSSQVYLRLIRQPNERRIAVEVHFADEKTLAPAVFAQLDQADIPGLQKDEALELSQTKHGWAYGAVVPLAQCGQAVSALVAALDQATSRAKS